MKWILDVSAAFEVARNAQKASLIRDTLDMASAILAPTHFYAEIYNTIWKYHQFKNYDVRDCLDLADLGLTLVDEFLRIELFSRKAFEVAINRNVSVYDAYYLSASMIYGAGLITLDKKLCKAAIACEIQVLEI